MAEPDVQVVEVAEGVLHGLEAAAQLRDGLAQERREELGVVARSTAGDAETVRLQDSVVGRAALVPPLDRKSVV